MADLALQWWLQEWRCKVYVPPHCVQAFVACPVEDLTIILLRLCDLGFFFLFLSEVYDVVDWHSKGGAFKRVP
jgi:hypothetical protein